MCHQTLEVFTCSVWVDENDEPKRPGTSTKGKRCARWIFNNGVQGDVHLNPTDPKPHKCEYMRFFGVCSGLQQVYVDAIDRQGRKCYKHEAMEQYRDTQEDLQRRKNEKGFPMSKSETWPLPATEHSTPLLRDIHTSDAPTDYPQPIEGKGPYVGMYRSKDSTPVSVKSRRQKDMLAAVKKDNDGNPRSQTSSPATIFDLSLDERAPAYNSHNAQSKEGYSRTEISNPSYDDSPPESLAGPRDPKARLRRSSKDQREPLLSGPAREVDRASSPASHISRGSDRPRPRKKLAGDLYTSELGQRKANTF